MATKLLIGKSQAPDAETATREASGRALRSVRSEPKLAVVLSTNRYAPDEVARAMTRAFGETPWAGCGFAGVFAGSDLMRDGLVIGVLDSKVARVGVGVAGPVSENADRAGAAAVAEALSGLPELAPGAHRALIVFPDTDTGNAAAVIRGAAQEGGSGVSWAGGGAGSGQACFAHGRPYRDHVVVIAIDTLRPMATGIRHGWRPYGPPTMVTRSRGNLAVELEYERAFDVYRRTAASRGDEVDEAGFTAFAMNHPLGIPQADGEHVIRDPLTIEPDGSLRCVAEVPDGCLVRIMEGSLSALLEAARTAATTARDGVGGPIGGAFVFDCISRSIMLGDAVGEELSTFQSGLGEGVPLMGCLTFGEVGALGNSVPQFHNKTAVVLALPGDRA